MSASVFREILLGSAGPRLEAATVPLGYLVFALVAVAFLGAGFGASALLRRGRSGGSRVAYEGGEEPVGSPWIAFKGRYYTIALIFILFEIEIAFMFPYALGGMAATTKAIALAEGVAFVAIVSLGLAYAWLARLLDWPTGRPAAPQQDNWQGPAPAEVYRHVYRPPARHASGK